MHEITQREMLMNDKAGRDDAPTRMGVWAGPLLVAALMLATPNPASAYIGPGAGLGVIGAAFAFIASLFLAIVGLIWYPLQKLWRAMRPRPDRSRERPSND